MLAKELEKIEIDVIEGLLRHGEDVYDTELFKTHIKI